jgi:hypothetical protein
LAGNPNPKGSKPDKLMRDALMIALNREAINSDGVPTKKLNLIADKLVDKAAEGDLTAIKEINDRVDGKAPQGITGDDENPLVLLHRIENVIVDSSQT